MKSKGITVAELLNQVPQSVFDELGTKSQVDHFAKKLTGQRVFQLLLHGLLSGKELSFRILETQFESPLFQSLLTAPEPKGIDHSSLAGRLATIKSGFFKSLFEHVSAVFTEKFSSTELKKYQIVRFDSTMISLSSKLLKMDALRTSGRKKPEKPEKESLSIKFSVGFDGTTVRQIELYNEQSSLSENVALRDVVEKTSLSKKDIAVFDKGITRRATYCKLSEDEVCFVTRIRTDSEKSGRKFKYEKVRDFTQTDPENPIKTPSLLIEEDIVVHLYDEKHRKTKQTFRLIKATRLENGEKINFLTNVTDLDAAEITEVYRLRWDIEVFFKFLKQEFSFKHFLCRNENGLRVMMYMAVIAAMLIYIYRKLNNIEGFKIAKLKFINELEREVIKIIIQLCQGKPELLHLKL